MLRLTDVSKTYAAHGVETHALSHFNLEVSSGEFLAITGSSGSGKTTFLNIAGLLEAAVCSSRAKQWQACPMTRWPSCAATKSDLCFKHFI